MAPREVTCTNCAKAFVAQRSTAKFCSETCRQHNHQAKTGRHPISTDMRFMIFRRDGFKCRYCGKVPREAELRVDHIVPIALGGKPMDEANLVTACFECNAGKGASPFDPSELPLL